MNKLSCECGCEEFDVKGGVTLPWWEHVLTCRYCERQYTLPVIYVNGNKYGKAEEGE